MNYCIRRNHGPISEENFYNKIVHVMNLPDLHQEIQDLMYLKK